MLVPRGSSSHLVWVPAAKKDDVSTSSVNLTGSTSSKSPTGDAKDKNDTSTLKNSTFSDSLEHDRSSARRSVQREGALVPSPEILFQKEFMFDGDTVIAKDVITTYVNRSSLVSLTKRSIVYSRLGQRIRDTDQVLQRFLIK